MVSFLPSYFAHTFSQMAEIHRVQVNTPPQRRVVTSRNQESRLAEADGVPPVKRLDGEVVRQGSCAYASGPYWEVWEGRWKKRSLGQGGGEETEERVSLSPIIPTPLMRPFVGRFESTSRPEIVRGGAGGLSFADRLYAASSRLPHGY